MLDRVLVLSKFSVQCFVQIKFKKFNFLRVYVDNTWRMISVFALIVLFEFCTHICCSMNAIGFKQCKMTDKTIKYFTLFDKDKFEAATSTSMYVKLNNIKLLSSLA